jgi:hypothetical protein
VSGSLNLAEALAGIPWDAAIAAVSGLTGVVVGGWITTRSQAQERRQRRLQQQLDEFYGPLIGMRALMQAKGKVREEVTTALTDAWQKICARFEGNPTALDEVTRARWPEYEQAIEYNDRDLREVLIPTYRAMVDLFVSKIALSEPSTRTHLPELVRYVEGWRPDLPMEVRREVGANENRLAPFYDDLERQLTSIQAQLTKGRRRRA